jgi:hypothetical protein
MTTESLYRANWLQMDFELWVLYNATDGLDLNDRTQIDIIFIEIDQRPQLKFGVAFGHCL